MEYVALLRGINISGKNKISMSQLKQSLLNNNFKNVITYLNSGNIIFNDMIQDKTIIKNKINSIIINEYKLNIPVLVLTKEDLTSIIENIPNWVNLHNKEMYNNIIYLIDPIKKEKLLNSFGKLIKYEKVENFKDIFYWSFSLKNYSKSNWWKQASTNEFVTIRTINTTKRILELMER